MFPAVIGWIVIILLFILIALTVVAIAMSGGPHGLRAAVQTQSRPGRKAIGLLLTLIIVGIGVAVPVVLAFGNADNHARDVPGAPRLTAQQEEGRVLFAQNCSNCHTLRAANAVGKVGPNLDQLRPPAALVADAIVHGRARGMGQMPVGIVQGPDVQKVASFVAAVAGR
jgi:mono/diheme cytochrome c family protein